MDVPQAWAGTSVCTNLANWPSGVTAKSVRAFRNALVAVNITKNSGANNYPHMVKWSNFADPGSVSSSWDEADPTVEAGEAELSDTTSELIDSLVLGDNLILYKEGAYYGLVDVGGGYVFRAQLISSELGMLATNCAAAFPGGHCVLGQGDVFVHSGGAPETILTARARRWLFNNLDTTYYPRSFVVANPAANEVRICVPTIGNAFPNVALVWNWKANTLGTVDLPLARHGAVGVVDSELADSWDSDNEPWDSDSTAWDQLTAAKSATRLVMAGDTKVVLADATSSFSGTAMTAMLERTGLALGAPERVKLLKGIRPIFEGSVGSTVTITVGGAMDAQAEPTWSDPVTFTVGTDLQADAFATGRFLAVRIESSGYQHWRLKKMQLNVETLGAY